MSGKGKTVFVTGGGGYVASHCIVQLLEGGYDVVACDDYSNAIREQSTDQENKPECLLRVERLTGKKLTFREVNLCDFEALKSVMSDYKIDCVIHCAAFKAVGESCREPIKYYSNNVVGSVNLVQAMKELGVNKIVFSSSSTVYGLPEYLPMDESHPVGKCTNPYGKTKFFMEEIIKDICKVNPDWSCILLRYFNPVGAHPSGDIGEDPQGVPYNLMPFIAQVAVGRREILNIFGTDYDTADGTAVRDYVHVMDVADGHVAAVDALVKPGAVGTHIYNLGIGHGATVFEVIKAFEDASGLKIPTKLTGRRQGDVPASYASCDLIEKELGWKAKLTLYDMCKDMWTWQSKNPHGYLKQ